MYETSTVKDTVESAAVLSASRTKSSEQVRGMMPLSAPSTKADRDLVQYHANAGSARSIDVQPIILQEVTRTSQRV